MRLQFVGSGDAFGSGGRFNTCFHVRTASSCFLVDCGASSLVALRRWSLAPNDIATVFVSHLHGIGRAVSPGGAPALVSVILDGENCW